MMDESNRIDKVFDKHIEYEFENKDLKARKARLMSVDRLRSMAKQHGLAQPKQNQIIVVP